MSSIVTFIHKGEKVWECTDSAKLFNAHHVAFVVTNKRMAGILSTLKCVTFATISRKEKGYLLHLTTTEDTTIQIDKF